MTLNIDGSQSTPDEVPRRSAKSKLLRQQVLDELTSWNPREFIVALRRWHEGDLSLVHLNVLTILESDGPLSMSRLAEALDVSVASATGIVDRMEKRGFVERRHGSEDRRVVVVHPTSAAGKIFEDLNDRRRRHLSMLLSTLDDQALQALLAGHRALREARAAVVRTAHVDEVDAIVRRAKAASK